MKTKYIILTCILIVICVELAIDYIPFLSPKQFAREQFDNFNKMFIHHRIASIEDGSKGKSVFTLENLNHKFIIYLVDQKSRKHFYQISHIGDSLYKPAHSDTIFLYKKDTVLKIYYNNNFE